MFRLEAFPAREGDCLILSWGREDSPRRILVDAGRRGTADAVMDYAARHGLGEKAFELFVITHIDRDHIEGAVALLRNPAFPPLVRQIWFNGRHDLDYVEPDNEYEEFGALDGERLTRLVTELGIPWNVDFAPRPVAVVRDDALPRIELPDGLVLTILSPDLAQLAALAAPWDKTIEEARPGWETFGPDDPIPIRVLAETPFRGDRAKPNGSSIAMIAEYDGRRLLLTGDAHVPRLLKSLEVYNGEGAPARFAAVKASHHGSRGNTSLELVRVLASPLWIFSTNGDQFKHPDQEAVARVLWGATEKTRLVFNYRTPLNAVWEKEVHPRREFACEFGEDGHIAVDIPKIGA